MAPNGVLRGYNGTKSASKKSNRHFENNGGSLNGDTNLTGPLRYKTKLDELEHGATSLNLLSDLNPFQSCASLTRQSYFSFDEDSYKTPGPIPMAWRLL
jgi:hypothetical protein